MSENELQQRFLAFVKKETLVGKEEQSRSSSPLNERLEDPKLAGISSIAEAPQCQICWDNFISDRILRCRKCRVKVHEKCYGTTVVGSDSFWRCKPCAEGQDPAYLKCQLCSIFGGAYKATTEEGWVHVVCFLPLVGVSYTGPDRNIVDLSSVVDTADKCYLDCGIKGNVIRCCGSVSQNCRRAVHPMCIPKSDMTAKYITQGKLFYQEVYCPEHVIDAAIANQGPIASNYSSASIDSTAAAVKRKIPKSKYAETQDRDSDIDFYHKNGDLQSSTSTLSSLSLVKTDASGKNENNNSYPTVYIVDDGECEVCGISDSFDSNPIVFCDGCNLAIHQECYNIEKIPDGSWYDIFKALNRHVRNCNRL
jgi:hypothetical protein